MYVLGLGRTFTLLLSIDGSAQLSKKRHIDDIDGYPGLMPEAEISETNNFQNCLGISLVLLS